MRGGNGQPRLREERGAPHYAGLARDARLSASASSARDVPGLQLSALGDSLPTTSKSRWESLWLLSGGAGSLIPGEKLGQPQRPGGASAKQTVTPGGQGARGELVILAQGTCSPPSDRICSTAAA